MLSVILTQAQNNSILLTPDEFESRMQAARPGGYGFGGIELDENELSALFFKGEDVINIRIMGLSHFGDYVVFSKKAQKKSGEYSLQNCRAYYFSDAEYSTLYLELIPQNACLTLTAKKPLDQNSCDKLVESLNLGNWKAPAGINWPAEILPAQRIQGMIRSIEKQDASTEGYAYEYHVVVSWNKTLVESVGKILTQYNGGLDVTDMDKFTFICSSTDSFDFLKTGFREGEEVRFIYYRKQ